MAQARAEGKGAVSLDGRLIDIASIRQAEALVAKAEQIAAKARLSRATGEVTPVLDFEKPISELEGKVKELRHLSSGSELDLADEITRLEARAEKLLRQTYAKLNAWQKTQVARHPERPHFSDYVAPPARGLHAARRRSDVRRRPRDPGRPRALPRPLGGRDRPREGHRHRGPRAPQFRHGQPGRLSQGGAADAPGRALRPARAHAGRHAGRLPGNRCRGARPGRGDRARDRDLPAARRAAGRGDHRRGRLRRRGRAWRSPTAC